MTAIECMSAFPDFRRNHHGFTMIELAVAIVIIAILLGTILVPLQTQVEQRQVSETQKLLDDIKEALVGHATTKGYLPCPDRTTGGAGTANDTANDGREDFDATGACFVGAGVNAGNVPWVTLGLGAMDPWGNRFRYKVEPLYARRSPGAPFNLSTNAGLLMCTTSTCAVRLTGNPPADGAVAVILSHGKNGFGAINAATATQQPNPVSFDELQNLGVGASLVSRTITPLGSAAGEFDDIVTWLGKYSLFNRMVAAGRLP